MQIFGAQYQSRRIRLLAALTFLLWVFVAPNGYVLYLMERREEFWKYHDGQWLNCLIGTLIVALIIGFFKRPWGIIIFAFGALIILAPLVANASLPGYQSLPDVSAQTQQQYQEVWFKELLTAIALTLICAAFWKSGDPGAKQPTGSSKPRPHTAYAEVLGAPTTAEQLPQTIKADEYWQPLVAEVPYVLPRYLVEDADPDHRTQYDC